MKLNRSEMVIDTETIELSADLPEAIERLMQMNGVCRESDSTDKRLEFYCDKKGKIFVTAPAGRYSFSFDRSSYVKAEVVNRNGKTYIDMYSVDIKGGFITSVVFAVIQILITVFISVIYALAEIPDLKIGLICVFISDALLIYFSLRDLYKEKNNIAPDLEKMKTEVRKRAIAVNRWNK